MCRLHGNYEHMALITLEFGTEQVEWKQPVLVPNFFEDGKQLRVKELSYDSGQRIR